MRPRTANATSFKKGVSGCPGGRPVGFPATIRALCGHNFEKLAQGYFVLAFGDGAARKAFFGEAVRVNAQDRLRAMSELRDSGAGRPALQLQHEGVPASPLFVIMPGAVRPAITRAQDGLDDIDSSTAAVCLPHQVAGV